MAGGQLSDFRGRFGVVSLLSRMVKSLGGSRQVPNMRGKRHLALRCRCCAAVDLRPKFQRIEHLKEMKVARDEPA